MSELSSQPTLPARLRRIAVSIGILMGSMLAYFLTAWVTIVLTGLAVAGAAAGAVAALVAFVLVRRLDTGTFQAPERHRAARIPLVKVGIGLCFVLVFLAGQTGALWLASVVPSPGWEANQVAREQTPLWLMLISALVLAPAGEEALLRGIVYGQMRKHLGVIASMVVSSATFALMHGNLVQISATLLLGALLALVFELTQRLWTVVALHVLFNLMALLIPGSVIAAITSPAVVVSLVVTSLLVLAALTAVILSPHSTADAAVDSDH